MKEKEKRWTHYCIPNEPKISFAKKDDLLSDERRNRQRDKQTRDKDDDVKLIFLSFFLFLVPCFFAAMKNGKGGARKNGSCFGLGFFIAEHLQADWF